MERNKKQTLSEPKIPVAKKRHNQQISKWRETKNKVLAEPKIAVAKKRQNQQITKWRQTKNEVLTDCSKFLKCMIFSKKHSKIKNIFSTMVYSLVWAKNKIKNT